MGILIAAAVVATAATGAFIAVRMRRGKGALPRVGEPAPDFTLPSQSGEAVSLGGLRGKWVVLYFYPKDFTPGCTIEARHFQRDLPQFEARNAIVLGVSGQDERSHANFCQQEGLAFKLLADRGMKVSRAYGSVVDLAVAKFSARHTFLIDPHGRVAKVYNNVDPQVHSGQILSDLRELQARM